MLRNKRIAAFIDVNNAALEMTNYENVLSQLEEMGEIVCAYVYGANERKHKKIIEHAMDNGFQLQYPRGPRRAKKVFDSRIWWDVATLTTQNRNVDAVAVVSGPADMTYMYGTLRRLGIAVIASDNGDENSMALVDAVLDLGKVEKLPLPKKPAPKKAPAEKKPEQPAEEDRTAQLLRDIEKLRQDYEKPAEQPAKEQKPAREQPAEDDSARETRELLDKIASLQKDEPQEAPQKQPEDTHQIYVSQDDNDLIRKIQELRDNNSGKDSDELVEQIKKLLDGVE